jgi:hypothetical protein
LTLARGVRTVTPVSGSELLFVTQVAPYAVSGTWSGSRSPVRTSLTRSRNRSFPTVSVLKASRLPSGLIEDAPSEKKSWPSASSFRSRSTSSSGISVSVSSAGGVQSSGPEIGQRQLMPYCLPSRERLKYQYDPIRDGTERSVSFVRERISSKSVSRSFARWAVACSV